MMRKTLNYVAIFILLAVIAVLGAFRFGFFKPTDSPILVSEDNTVVEEVKSETKTESIKTIETSGKIFDVKNQEQVYKLIHEMTNTLIVAEDAKIWGEIQITDEILDKLISAMKESSFDDKEKILTILNRWKNKDYSQGVEEHNYVWRKLRGNIGKAIKLRDNIKK